LVDDVRRLLLHLGKVNYLYDMIHVYNGSKWTEKKFDSVGQMSSKLDFDVINDDAGFRKAFNHGKINQSLN